MGNGRAPSGQALVSGGTVIVTNRTKGYTAALEAFVRESNRIEGIDETTDAHIEAHHRFLSDLLTIPAIVELVSVLQPDARFRNMPGIPGVRVGNHIAPPSGPDIEGNLRSILTMADPWEQHIAYETLHPFTDGNGRSGRAIWLHRHYSEIHDPYAFRRGFLHSWYYHTLSSVRVPVLGQPGQIVAEIRSVTDLDDLQRIAEAVRERVAGIGAQLAAGPTRQ